mgnify:FL=1|jgi:hypothetical protein|tara:strand:- start:399 stop:668 length:270 start_codon:yes stop_codon:yes gene_type:complete
MAYYYVQHTGKKGFVTHADNESAHVANYPGDVWVTENSAWASRVGAEEKTKSEAQALCDAAIGAANAELSSSAGWSNDTQPTSSLITLP